MHVMFRSIIGLILLIQIISAQDQKKDQAIFTESKNEFWDLIHEENQKFRTPEEGDVKKVFKMDFSGMDLPVSIDQFENQWHQQPLSQGNTGSCWCFCATSFFEAEVQRLQGKKIKISEMYTVYWEFVEKARRYVQERGNSLFDHGSMGNAVIRIWNKYGAVPAESYSGMLPEQKFHDHGPMFDEMNHYLEFIKENNIWNEADVLGNIKSILNYHMGEPPLKIIVDGLEMTPLEYLDDHVKLNLDDYVDLLSLKQETYYEYVKSPVPDNWWFNSDYYNLPLEEFVSVANRALSRGYTVLMGGDVSEAGHDSHTEVAMIPSFDIPSSYIDEDARQFRFSNKSTTDDHGIHAVGIMKSGDAYWYLIKDSGSGAQNGPNKGYRFFHQDYVKLKMLDFMVHKDMIDELPNMKK